MEIVKDHSRSQSITPRVSVVVSNIPCPMFVVTNGLRYEGSGKLSIVCLFLVRRKNENGLFVGVRITPYMLFD